MADDGATTISCSVVLKLQSGSTTHHLIRNISNDTGFLRSGATSGVLRLTFPALWSSLKLRAQDDTKALLPSVLAAAVLNKDHASILVATTRSLIFDDHLYQQAENAYRVLGPLSSFSLEWEHHIPSDRFHETTDIFGISNECASNHTFVNVWEDADVHIRTHFALILHISPGPHTELHNPAFLEMNHTPASPALNTHIFSSPPPWRLPTQSPQCISSQDTREPISSPASPSPSTRLPPPARPTPSTRSPPSSPSTTYQDSVVNEILLSSFNATDAAFLKARAIGLKGSRKTGLTALAGHFYAMQKILCSVLGTQGSITLQNGMCLDRRQILARFGWQANTFSNKIAVYAKGKEISLRMWTAEIP
ncbi:hypothetical protein C8F01DRAFT_1374079, partial [Mycena amicta]